MAPDLGLGSTLGFQVCACMTQHVTGLGTVCQGQAGTGPHDAQGDLWRSDIWVGLEGG